MRTIIVGGGKVGFYLAKTLLEQEHSVVIIEQDKEQCHFCANNLDAEVSCGDGTSGDTLRACGAEEADAVIAVMVLLLTPISAILATVIAKKSAKEYNKLWEEYDAIYAYAEETYGGIETVKNFGMESGRLEEYTKISARLADISKKANFLSSLVQPVVGFVNHVS
ncbi:MAG: hypothetical protein E7478_00990, partial [Ruminococcaceae bacterium]|nr:hypothetical protein [Oscillospiraceae bacterium]